MKTRYIFFIFMLFSNTMFAQNFVWAKNGMGGSKITTDHVGNIYTTGYFQGTIDADPGTGIVNLAGAGITDVFITKADSSGHLLWAKAIGGNGADWGFSLEVDLSGNVYIVGSYEHTVDFDAGPGTFNLNANGGNDVFILKLDSSGNFIWAKSVGGIDNDEACSLIIDAYGNPIVTGDFSGTANFDTLSGTYIINPAGPCPNTGFIFKLDGSGNMMWGVCILGMNIRFTSIAIDRDRNLLTTGVFVGNVDFDPGAGIYYLDSNPACDAFVLKLDSSGNFVWAKQTQGVSYCTGLHLKTDSIGNVYTIGQFYETVDFDPGPAVYTLTGGIFGIDPSNIFILKLDVNGNFIWVKQIGAQIQINYYGNDEFAIDSSGNLFITGSFSGTVDFDPSVTAIYNVTSTANNANGDIFILKLDHNGEFVSSKFMGGIYNDMGTSITCDQFGNIITIGSFAFTVDFDPGPGIYNVTGSSNGGYGFLLKLKDCQSSSHTLSTTACDSYTLNGQTYTASGTYTQQVLSASGCDSIIHLILSIHPSSSFVISQSTCNSYTLNGQTYSNSGVYTQTLLNAVGCDSIITLTLTVNSSFISINQSACSSFTFNGQTYTSSGIYSDTSVNAIGCDSITVLNLSIHSPTNAIINQTACDMFTLNGITYTNSGTYSQNLINSNGCDSTLNLNLQINASSAGTLTANECKHYTFNGQTYTASGLYTQTLVNAAGCDSLLTLDIIIDTVNTAVTQTGFSMYSMAPGATYQWIHCEDYVKIIGATNQGYTALANGSYAVVVTQSGCVDTSECVTINSVNSFDYSLSNTIHIAPNPTHGKVVLTTGETLSNAILTVVNLTGETVLRRENLNGTNFTFDLMDKANGIYIIEVLAGSKVRRLKLIKE